MAATDLTAPTATRRCGRCLGEFPIAAGTHPMELRDWWMCEQCADSLIPGRHRDDTAEQTNGAPS